MALMRTLKTYLVITVFCAGGLLGGYRITAAAGTAQAADLDGQRQAFLAAETALRKGQVSRYRQLKAGLSDYPLLPYLEYDYLRKRLYRLPEKRIEQFLHNYPKTPLAERLRGAWLDTLSRQGRWQAYLKFYRPDGSTGRQCLQRWAQYQTGHDQLALEGLERLWIVGHSQPRNCDRIFAVWEKSDQLTTERVWQRFELAMQNRHTRLARYLVRFLPKKQKKWARLWLRVHRQPQLVTVARRFAEYHPLRNTILVDALQRLAYRDLDLAVKSWDILRNQYPFNEAQRNTVERSLAMRYALQRNPEALGWLASLPEPDVNDTAIGEWRIRSALVQENWEAVLYEIGLLSEQRQNTTRWRYWRARALEALGRPARAYEFYWELARNRGYYGFLAADRLGIGYQFENQAATVDPDDIDYLTDLPGLVRAHELFALGRQVDARREWIHVTRSLSEDLLRQAAVIADDWGWHDRAILTMAQTRYRDDLDLRFPLAYRDDIAREAQNNDIDEALAFALIRQESAFTSDARSHAGALGLMQLMPRTARSIARRSGIKYTGSYGLTDADTNLKLGMRHLRKVMNRYRDNPVLATAAYNAGEYRVKQWIPEQGSLPADIWTETLPFSETRNYVQNILYFATIYEQRLGGQHGTTISQRMPAIGAHEAVLAGGRSPTRNDPS
jgi:soluble lytic murein transglycosylase